MFGLKRKGIKEKKQKKIKKKKFLLLIHEEEEEEEEDLFMDFDKFWKIVEHHGRVAAYYKAECEHLWTTYTPEQQEAIVRTIDHKLRTGLFVHYNPAYAMRDNTPKTHQTKILSYAEYYKTFGTTEEVKGWHMENPTGNQVIYVKE